MPIPAQKVGVVKSPWPTAPDPNVEGTVAFVESESSSNY
jgi:hypothetical protein